LNIVISCCGTRNSVVRYFKQELDGKGEVIATDCSPLAPALYEADTSYVVSRILEPGYPEELLEICRRHRADAILSLLDPELLLLAEHREQFLDIGTLPVISPLSAIATSFDKVQMNSWMEEHGFPSLKTYLSMDAFQIDYQEKKIAFPVFIKPRCGSGSVGASVVFTMEELAYRTRQRDDLIIQEYVQGVEYSIDVYSDMISGEPAGFFLREKLRKRDGETDKCVSAVDDLLCAQVFRLIREFGLKGPLDFDVIRVGGLYYIIDVNPRFGGGYPVAFSHGINFFAMILKNLAGEKNPPAALAYEPGVYSMKYYETMTRRDMAGREKPACAPANPPGQR
jgi:carbamoyl-phosphate synthase large subunit